MKPLHKRSAYKGKDLPLEEESLSLESDPNLKSGKNETDRVAFPKKIPIQLYAPIVM